MKRLLSGCLASASTLAYPICAAAQQPAPAADTSTTVQAAEGAPAAEQPPATFEDASPEIVVTAQRRAQSLSDVGMSVSAIGGEMLRTRNVNQVEDLAKLVTGLSVSSSGFSTPIYTLRGVGINEPSIGSTSSVAVYVDEVPLAYPVISQGASIDLQRIEVLKGPQGTLYGQNSTGGAINYIANKPTKEFHAGLSGSLGRFATGMVEGYVSGPLTPTLRARVAGRYTRGDGWQRSITRDDTLGDVRNFTGRAIVEWEPTERFQLTLNANGWRDRSDTQAAQFLRATPATPALAVPAVLNAPVPPEDARAADWDPGRDYRRNDRFWQASARADWELADALTLTSISAYTHFRREQLIDYDGIANAVAVLRDQDGKIESFSQEVRLAANFHGVQWIAGVNLTDDTTSDSLDEDIRDSSPVRNLGGFPANGAGTIVRQKIKGWGVFTNIEVPLTDRLTAAGGIRLSREIRRFEGCGTILDDFSSTGYTSLVNILRGREGLAPVGRLAPGQCFSLYRTAAGQAGDTGGLPLLTPGLAHRELDQTNTPWNLNLNWKPNRDLQVYARVSRGYKSGNFATLGALDPIVYGPIVQEELTAYEVGTRFSVANVLRVEAAAFRYDYTNKQVRARVNAPPVGNISAQDNIPESRIDGVELSGTLTPVSGFSLTAAGTYLDSKVRRYSGYTVLSTVPVDLSGSRFNFTPKYSVNVDASYTRPLSDEIDGFVGANLAYRSSTSAVFVPPGAAGFDDFDIDAYTLVDGQIGVERKGRWKAWIWGKNVFNKYYWTNIVKAADVTVRFPGMPATYGVSASFTY